MLLPVKNWERLLAYCEYPSPRVKKRAKRSDEDGGSKKSNSKGSLLLLSSSRVCCLSHFVNWNSYTESFMQRRLLRLLCLFCCASCSFCMRDLLSERGSQLRPHPNKFVFASIRPEVFFALLFLLTVCEADQQAFNCPCR